MKIRNILAASCQRLAQTFPENFLGQAEQILSSVLKCNRSDLYLNHTRQVNSEEIIWIESIIQRRILGEPLQYILGETWFYGCSIQVNHHVLIPRPETELLVEKIIRENNEPTSILDLGTGSGAIAIALAKHYQKSVTAIDISPEALKTAEDNAARNGVTLRLFQSDLFDQVPGKFAIIVSNPPYIGRENYDSLPVEIKDYEPRSALFAEENGLYFYRKILEGANKHLEDNGSIYFEIGFELSGRIKKVANKNGFQVLDLTRDLNGFERIMKIGRIWTNS